MSGATVSATVGSTAVSGNVVADDCTDNSEEEAPLSVVDDATEMVYCTANEAVDKAKESLEDLNGNSDCLMWQESDKPYNVYLEEHCDIDHPWNGDGRGTTDYSITSYGKDKRHHTIELSDGDTKEMIRLIDEGVPIAAGIAAVSASFYAGPYAGAVMMGVGLAVHHQAHDWTDKMEDKNEGCGVIIGINHRKIHDYYRSDPFDEIYHSDESLWANVSTQQC
jgi:hypothetical protein